MSATSPNFKKLIDARDWDVIRDTWLEDIPVFPSPGAPPDPGVERLPTLQTITLPEARSLLPDVVGLRRQVLWEAIFLFHKCAHTHLAAQRLGCQGMHSWAMFNAYHSAYLGARCVLSLFGIAFPFLPQGGQLIIDLYPAPEKPSKRNIARDAREFLIFRSRLIEQTQLWEAFARALRVTKATKVLRGTAIQELADIDPADFSPPRNAFLYRSHYWPAVGDLLTDGKGGAFDALMEVALDADEIGFLLRLSCHVYRVCEALCFDLGALSAPIQNELDQSRVLHDPVAADLTHYNTYLKGVRAADAALAEASA